MRNILILLAVLMVFVACEKQYDIKEYDIKDEVVIDTQTGLMWQRTKAPDAMEHADAIQYCENLTLDGYSDWRLPSISELKTLIVDCQSGTGACKVSDDCLSYDCFSDSCYCETSQGPGEDGYYWQPDVWKGGGSWFWSSSVRAGYSDLAWRVGFDNGLVYDGSRYNASSVRCVRGRP